MCAKIYIIRSMFCNKGNLTWFFSNFKCSIDLGSDLYYWNHKCLSYRKKNVNA